MSIERPDFIEKNNEQEKNPESFPLPDEYINQMEALGFKEHAEAYKKVLEIAEVIKLKGGRALLVGGSVRDFFMGKISKDFDLEVYGLEADILEQTVQPICKVRDVGKSFGILKARTKDGIEIDLSLPRTDSKIDVGHRGFEIKTDPHMSIEEAAKRRDFTINSMAADPLTGEFYDPWNGLEDLKNRILKVTDPERFVDDPARVLRALQFVARFGLKVEQETLDLLQELTPQLKEEPKERIGEEWKKLLTKSEKPSLGLSLGMSLGVFHEIHPEIPPLAETKQDPNWHPEGDVWIHTLMVVDEAAKITSREQLDENQKITVMLASLCHDFGKPQVTEEKDNHIKSYGHEKAGEEPTKKFLSSIGVDLYTKDKVVKLVKNHLAPTMAYIEENVRGNQVKKSVIRRMAERIYPATINELSILGEADHMGRGSFDPEVREQSMLPTDRFPVRKWLLGKAREINAEDGRALDVTRGRDWINFGYSQNGYIGELIRLSNTLRDEKNLSREAIFSLVDQAEDEREAVIILNSVSKK